VVGLCCSAEPLSLFRQRSVIPQGQSDHWQGETKVVLVV
jgi:hypothetical protein